MLEFDTCNLPSTITLPLTIIFIPSSAASNNAPDSIFKSPFISKTIPCLIVTVQDLLVF